MGVGDGKPTGLPPRLGFVGDTNGSTGVDGFEPLARRPDKKSK
jgi:hypothetical protein